MSSRGETLRAAMAGDSIARASLLADVYEELRRLAHGMMAGDRLRPVMSPTELVHGAAIKLLGMERLSPQDRQHFLALSATVMRQVLIDQARRQQAEKRAAPQVTLSTDLPEEIIPPSPLDGLLEALDALSAVSAPHARLVELRYFSGLTIEEIAAMDGVSPATVKRSWRAARAWLRTALLEKAAP